MINPETDPWANRDAANAAGYAVWHAEARAAFEASKTPGLANAMTRIQNIRETHQTNTGWVAEHQGEGEWVFTYSDPTQVDPDTGYKTGQAVTITTKEKP